MKEEGMRHKLDSNETFDESEELIEKEIVRRLNVILLEIETGEVPFG